MISAVAFLALFAPKVLEVGDGKPFARIEEALAACSAGDEIDVFPKTAGYSKSALLVEKQVQIIAKGAVTLAGDGFDYSGSGKTPRAIVQFEPGSSGSVLEGFLIEGAHNQTYNAAGIRIREASNVSVWQCELTANDMGVMSNGKDGESASASKQRFERCLIHDNGNKNQAGYNHNLYVGGSSVYLDACLIYNPLTGHNLKSRAHLTSVTNCAIYGGNNRQIDCVDSWFTTLPNSDLLVYNSILAMDPNSIGNGNVVHFGQESGKRDGRAYLYQSSIYTAFLTPILTLDSADNRAEIRNCVILDPDPITPQLLSIPSPYPKDGAQGQGNAFSTGYQVANLQMPVGSFTLLPAVPAPPAVPDAKATAYGLKGITAMKVATLPFEGKLLVPLTYPGASPNLFKTIQAGLVSTP